MLNVVIHRHRRPIRGVRPVLPTVHRPPSTARAFTLTEVLISLAMVSILLIGISRIFALTSQTIGTGQALSKAVRAQRAIQQTLAGDITGVGPDVVRPDLQSGMVPLGEQSGAPAPSLIISNYRVATYKNETDARADINAPVAGDSFEQRSLKIRGIDLNANGNDTDAGETQSIFSYGQRNVRVDSIGFYARGDFRSQTGARIQLSATAGDTSESYQNNIASQSAYIWYGHLAVFNGQVSRIPWQNSFGSPGSDVTLDSGAQPGTPPTGRLPNRNNQFSEQFLLGRVQTLMVEPFDHDQNAATPNTVVGNDLSPIYFNSRLWTHPRDTSNGSPSARTPMSFSSVVRSFNYYPSSGPRDNYQVGQKDEVLSPTYSSTPPALQAENCRSDVAGVGMQAYYDRLKFLQTESTAFDVRDTWWDPLFCRYDARYRINPFPAQPFDARSMSQRSQLLSGGCPQFIVEYAGDFVTQDRDGVVIIPGSATSVEKFDFRPDGQIDFVLVNGVRQTRWYGMPRDVDGDGVIVGNTNSGAPAASSKIYTSADVIPVRDMLGGRMRIVNPAATGLVIRQSFEVAAPAAATNYLAVVAEVANPNNTGLLTGGSNFFTRVDTEDTGYICAWGPVEFENLTPVSAVSGAKLARPVPQMLRFIVDTVDPEGKLREPVRLEIVYPVPVAK